MAEMTNGPMMGVGLGVQASSIIRFSGAAVSLGLLVGMGVWGYKLVVRDATGIPIVRAMEGPMRELPSNPGGTLTGNTGLAVNEVVALGGATEPEDVLVLAPRSAGLTEEDLMTQPTAEAGEVTPEAIARDAGTTTSVSLGGAATSEIVTNAPDAPMTADEILALADQISAGVDPLGALAQGTDVPVSVTVNGAEVAHDVAVDGRIPASVSGVTISYRPPARPGDLQLIQASANAVEIQATSAVLAAPSVDVSAIEAVVAEAQQSVSTSFAAGTALVHLGTYPNPEAAQSAWNVVSSQFAEFLGGKENVIQEGSAGGVPFYRLRAAGFAGMDDARRFCAALVAEHADCVPVQVQ